MDASIFLENQDGTFTGIYCAYLPPVAIVGYDIMGCLIKHYNTIEKAQKLINYGHIDHIGEFIEPSPLILNYGIQYLQHPAYQRLDFNEQIELANENWHHTEPMTAGLDNQNFQCKNLDECIKDFDNFNHGYRFIGQRGENDKVVWTYVN